MVDLRDDFSVRQWEARIERPTCLQAAARRLGMRGGDDAVLRQLVDRTMNFRVKRHTGRNWMTRDGEVLTISIFAEAGREPNKIDRSIGWRSFCGPALGRNKRRW